MVEGENKTRQREKLKKIGQVEGENKTRQREKIYQGRRGKIKEGRGRKRWKKEGENKTR